MGALIVLLYVLEVIVSLMLIGIVMIQQSKSQGGLGALAGGMTESVFGAAAGNVITKTTVALATIFLANTLVLAILTGNAGDSATRAEKLKQGEKSSEVGADTGSQAEIPEDIKAEAEAAARKLLEGTDIKIEGLADPEEVKAAMEAKAGKASEAAAEATQPEAEKPTEAAAE